MVSVHRPNYGPGKPDDEVGSSKVDGGAAMLQLTLSSFFSWLSLLAAGCTSPAPPIGIADDLAVVAYEEAVLGRLATRSAPEFFDQGDGVVGFTLFPDGSVVDVAVIE